MAKPATNKKQMEVRNNEANEVDEDQDEGMQEVKNDVASSGKTTWLKRPDWTLEFQGNNLAIIGGVNDEDFELLQKDDNNEFAKDVSGWVARNAGKRKISRYQVKGSLFNIGTRGPGPEDINKNPYKMRPAKAARGTAEKGTRVVTREITTQDVVAFLLAGKLDTEAFKEAMDGVRSQRMEQIRKLQMELASFDTFEKLATSGRTIGG